MREYIYNNVREIKKHLKKRQKVLSKLNKKSISEEFKEWNEDLFKNKEIIWTLPDLTINERFNNFCRSIKKEIK
tara:strand:- start:150 stop:371 length:222 start_codon:yes stop_codon:yes gene_type:complete